MKIIWTQYALNDLQDIRSYLKQSESLAFARKVTQEILAEVSSLKDWNIKGSFVPELEDLHLTTHRQLLAGQNRIIIEYGHNDIVHVHMIAHTNRDLEALIRHRLLNS
ncbi:MULTISPECIES: type II toxin-antitoxin system RelE/ParE family toxin [unclassified Janthinobacterium]|uniref:type II toxin-antitoxin system RelE/ParE family toxin n=1 Tax=unclassified Janthinobacterium TaxID=2610881 RepID=UPI001C5A6AF6|nr:MULTISPECIES: type II toxin-antitoxin system RelE/ParE family toxin [unclassified Janthinobacterium]MBW3501677.1 type II toxin-antitoxin system RelE/ParE family toxin [Janthinobacterium sp. NKUCC08_JDC]MDX8121757.1 type II toxin-antitoxin system RelE/ParE family toxin [Janthinobacterium sp. GMG2]